MTDDDAQPTVLVSAMWWSEDHAVVAVVSDALAGRVLTRGVLFDPDSLAVFLPFGLSLYVD